MQDWLKENPTEVWVEEVKPPSSPDCNSILCYFVWGESELWVIAKSHNKTEDLIQKIKQVMGYFNREPWRRRTRA
jgi:hypothetical protein